MSVAHQFVDLVGGRKLPSKSMAKLRETVLIRKHQTRDNESAVKTLVRLLTEDDTISYASCTGSYDEAKQLVKVRKKRKSKGKKFNNELNNNISLEHENFVKDVVLGLSLRNREFLISVMWVDEIAKWYHKLCPDALGADVAYRNNTDKTRIVSRLQQIH